MSKVAFVTGGTGFLGRNIVEELLLRHMEVFLLVRGENQNDSRQRIANLFQRFASSKSDHNFYELSKIRVFCGNVEQENLGLNAEDYKFIIENVDEIYHSAALCDFEAPWVKFSQTNIAGTENLIKFALNCKRHGKLGRVHHISTVAVGGDAEGILREVDYDINQNFNNDYEKSKYMAEKLLPVYRSKGLDITIYRPSIITGDSKTGVTSNFKMFYQPLHFLSLELFEEIPGKLDSLLNLVPVDQVARAVVIIAQDQSSANGTFHITNDYYVTLGVFLRHASDFFGFKMPTIVDRNQFKYHKLSPLQQKLLQPYVPYLNYTLTFNNNEAAKILSQNGFRWAEPTKALLNTIFTFCEKCKFIRKKEASYECC